MTRLETQEQAVDFIISADPAMDVDMFWDALGVSQEAWGGLATVFGVILNLHPAAVLTCMEMGARLALRSNVGSG